jgi:hypothetical protein
MTRRCFVFSSLAQLALSALAGEEAPAAIQRTAVTSTSLTSVGYDRAGQVLEVEFRSGAVYRYLAVPERIHRELLAAESKGRYFSQHIRGRFHFRRMEEARP